ncbi:Gfo/Idh/MocA family oxidoreductase [Aurantimonas sp. Leaf443]|uniref:Gfo/Idh/MocA family protein n=1 Tax=Aurantimonas sp. Leaf443 TaxID=1736378 RepID=UPI0006F7A758|nr:Gfo/Idh/MocA family oxidoreductase [Aurantimonas sp. Leaf443]KQT84096.1 oxidoreductase [Aurantimonas sp. Leaf443]
MIVGTPNTRRPLRWAMVGGGRGSQIGYIHRAAAARERAFELVAGAFDIDAAAGRAFGVELGLDPGRCYATHAAMFAAEAARADGIEAVSIATPNNTHFAIARAALEHGLHVVCEKPLCFTLAQAEALEALAQARGRVVGVTYGYSGYPMIEQARAMVENGDLGEIRLVNLQFAHGFHSQAVEETSPGTAWRVDPRFAGPSYVLGDIGTHPLYISQVILPHLKIRRLLCARQSFVKSRAPLEDNAVTLMEYDTGAFGTLWASAVNAGGMHGQKVRIVGAKASLEWWDEHPNQLSYEVQGEPVRLLDRGMPYLYPQARQDDRIGPGHPEGLFEGWANLYYRFAIAMEASDRGEGERLEGLRFPGIEAGVEGVRWVENCVRSADLGGVWVDYR